MTTIPPPMRLHLLSDSNVALLGRYLANDEQAPEIEALEAPFGQLWQGLAAPAEGQTKAGAAVVWARPEAVSPAFARRVAGNPADDKTLEADVDAFTELVLEARSRWQTILVPSFTLAPWQRGLGLLDLRPGIGLAAGLQTMNRRLAHRLDEADVYVLDADRWLRIAGEGACPPQAYFAGKIAFAPKVFEQAALDIRAALNAVAGRAKKLLALDLDDTLWGGIVGDTGVAGLRLGGHDAVGEAYVAFQQALLAHHRRGVQLAIVSKNEESVALEAIDRHPEMILRRQHFAGWRISWADKAQALADLCAELALGVEAAVFIDDNPVERARVRDALPGVLVPEWPADPCRYVEALGRLRVFDLPALSAEDRDRGQMYAAERTRRASQQAASSLDDWLVGLEQRVIRRTLDAADMPRAAQLLNKTNQMNLTTRRLSEGELARWAKATDHELWTFRVRDRFGDSGLTGILSVAVKDDGLDIVDLVLSCRVMARGIEETMLATAVAYAHDAGLAEVTATYCETARNAPCLTLLRRSGFRELAGQRFSWDAAEAYVVPPAVCLETSGDRAAPVGGDE